MQKSRGTRALICETHTHKRRGEGELDELEIEQKLQMDKGAFFEKFRDKKEPKRDKGDTQAIGDGLIILPNDIPHAKDKAAKCHSKRKQKDRKILWKKGSSGV